MDEGSSGKLTDDYKQKLKDAENVYIADGDYLKQRPPVKYIDLPRRTEDFLSTDGKDYTINTLSTGDLLHEFGGRERNVSLWKKLIQHTDFIPDNELVPHIIDLERTGETTFKTKFAANTTAFAPKIARLFQGARGSFEVILDFEIRKLSVRSSDAKNDFTKTDYSPDLDTYYFVIDRSKYSIVVNRPLTVNGVQVNRTYKIPLWAFQYGQYGNDPNALMDYFGQPAEKVKDYIKDYHQTYVHIIRGTPDFDLDDYVINTAVINPASTDFVKKNEDYTIENTDPNASNTDYDAVLDSITSKTLLTSPQNLGGKDYKMFINQDINTLKQVESIFLDDNGTPTFFFCGLQYRYISVSLESVLEGPDLLPSLESINLNSKRKLVSNNKKLDKPTFPIKAITYLTPNNTFEYPTITSGIPGPNINRSNSQYKLELGTSDSAINVSGSVTRKGSGEIPSRVSETSIEKFLTKNPGFKDLLVNIREVLGVYDDSPNPFVRTFAHETQKIPVHLYPDIKFLHPNSDIPFYGYKELNDGTKITIHPSGPGMSIAKKTGGYDFATGAGNTRRTYRGKSDIVTEYQTPLEKAQESFAQARPAEGKKLEDFPRGNGFSYDGFGITILVHTDDYDPTEINGTAEFNRETETRARRLDTSVTSNLDQTSGRTLGNRVIPGLGGGGMNKVRAMVFLYYDYSQIDLNKWVEDNKCISAIIPEGLKGYSDVRYSYVRDSVSDSKDIRTGYGFGSECFVKFTANKDTSIGQDATRYRVFTGEREDVPATRRGPGIRPRKGKYVARQQGRNRVYWPMGDASWARYFAPAFVASKSLKMFDNYNYHNGRELLLPYRDQTNATGVTNIQPKFIQNVDSPADTFNQVKFARNSQSVLSYGYHLQTFHAKPTFYTFERTNFYNLRGRNALINNHIVHFSETGILRQDFYSDSVSDYFNGLFPGTDNQEVYNSLGLELDNYPTTDPSERPVTQEFYNPLTHEADPVTQIITRNPTSVIISTIEGIFNSVGNFLQSFVMNQFSRTGIDSRLISEDEKSIVGTKENALVRVAFSEEGGGFITNVLNTENKDVKLSTHIVPLLSRHRILLGFTPGTRTVYCFSFSNNRGYKGVTKWEFKNKIRNIKALDDHRLLITFIQNAPHLSFPYGYGILDMDVTDDTLFEDTYKFVERFNNSFLRDVSTDVYDSWFETLPVIDIEDEYFSPYAKQAVTGVTLGISGFIDLEVQINDSSTRIGGKIANLRQADPDNLHELQKYTGFYTAKGLGFSGIQPTVRVTAKGNRRVSFSSLIISLDSGSRNRGGRYG